MEFIRKFYHSLYDYKWIAAQKNEVGKNWQYLLFLCLFFAFLTVLPALWAMPKIMQRGQDYLNKNIPDFSVEIKDGKLVVDKLDQPFIREVVDDKNERTVMVVDTVTTSTLDASSFAKSDTDNVILVTKDGFVLRGGEGSKTEIQNFKNFPSGKWDRSMLLGWFDKLRGGWGYGFTAILFVFIFVTTVLGEMVYIAFMSLWIWIIARVAKRNWNYSQIFHMGLLIVTLRLVLRLISVFLNVNVPILHSAVYWLLALLAIFWQNPVASDVVEVDKAVAPSE